MRSAIFSLGAILISICVVNASTVKRETHFSCSSKRVLSQSFIGENNDILVESAECDSFAAASTPVATISSPAPTGTSNGTDVCGATCSTNCFTPSGTAPDVGDCTIIADALLFSNQSQGQIFTVGPTGNKTNVVSLAYKTCFTMIVNQVNETISYCRDDWSTLTSYLSSDCDSTNNAHGGDCIATDGRWFIQVNHS